MDRFAMRLSLGYVEAETEVAIIAAQGHRHPLESIESCVSMEDIVALKERVKDVRVSDELMRYAVDIIRASRTARSVQLGAGPRASIALIKSAQALALMDGLAFVTPEHIRELAVPVLAHRLVIDARARFGGMTAQSLVEDILNDIRVPA